MTGKVSTVYDSDIRDLAELVAVIAARCWPNLGTDESRRIQAKALKIRDSAASRAAPDEEHGDV